jgi:hypothetical protein
MRAGDRRPRWRTSNGWPDDERRLAKPKKTGGSKMSREGRGAAETGLAGEAADLSFLRDAGGPLLDMAALEIANRRLAVPAGGDAMRDAEQNHEGLRRHRKSDDQPSDRHETHGATAEFAPLTLCANPARNNESFRGARPFPSLCGENVTDFASRFPWSRRIHDNRNPIPLRRHAL